MGAFILAASLRVVVHECAHAVTLRVFGIPYRTEWLPLDDGRPLRSAAIGAVARVTPGAPLECSAWRLRTAAVAPLVLLAPFVLVRAGVLADPLADQPTVAMAAAGWLTRAMPSPSDFSLSWDAERAIDEHADRATRRHGLAGRVTR